MKVQLLPRRNLAKGQKYNFVPKDNRRKYLNILYSKINNNRFVNIENKARGMTIILIIYGYDSITWNLNLIKTLTML